MLIRCRSLLFMFLMYLALIPFCTLGLLTLCLPFRWRYAILTQWQRFTVFLAKCICGIHYHIQGLEHTQALHAAVVVSNHQSTWETLAFFQFFPQACFVLKQELLRIPFFGWTLRLLNPIAIDRTAGKQALNEVIKQGRVLLAKGRWVIIFPEGHRMPQGTLGEMKPGGIFLATQTGTPVIPVIHNAGHYWPRRAFTKTPGTIEVIVGKPIHTEGRSASEVMKEVRAWMEQHFIS